jgi:hypothetical protein
MTLNVSMFYQHCDAKKGTLDTSSKPSGYSECVSTVLLSPDTLRSTGGFMACYGLGTSQEKTEQTAHSSMQRDRSHEGNNTLPEC